MRIVIVVNPVSGRGRALATSEKLTTLLVDRGHQVTIVASEPRDARSWLAARLADTDAVAVVGGDGTVRSVAFTISEAGVPMVHVPQGNENLFARSLGMGHRLEDSLALLESGEETLIDVGCVDGKAMLLMASIGLDAEIVSDVALNRGNQVSNLDYLRACLRNLHGRRPPQMTIVVDGEPVIAGQRGWVVVSNASEYGAQVNPAPMARLDDQLLDMTFFRASSGVEVFAWMARCRAGRQVGASGFVHRRSACSVVITTSEPTRWQLDGDPPPDGASPKTDRLSISIWNRGLPVLTCRQ